MTNRPHDSSRPDEEAADSDVARLNRAAWDCWSDDYQAKHGWLLRERAAAWGLWRIPESELHVLGDITGRWVLELGCGAAHWSRELSDRGANVIGVDNSARQLAHATMARVAGVRLVQASAERLPFRPDSIDVIFSDYGGMSWADPVETVPEVARVLRPGGLLAFCTASPLFFLCLDSETGRPGLQLQRDYFGMRRRTVAGKGVDFHVPFGEWFRLFSRYGLVVEDLIEITPPEAAVTTFQDRPVEWARRWPAENIWRVRRLG